MYCGTWHLPTGFGLCPFWLGLIWFVICLGDRPAFPDCSAGPGALGFHQGPGWPCGDNRWRKSPLSFSSTLGESWGGAFSEWFFLEGSEIHVECWFRKAFPVNCFQQLKEIKRIHSVKLIRSIANHASSTFSGDSLRFQLFVFNRGTLGWGTNDLCGSICFNGGLFLRGILKQLHFRLTSTVDYDRWDCCLISKGAHTSYIVTLKPGGGEFVWIDLVYMFCQMWDGPPAYTVVQAKPKLVRRQECKGPLSETSGTQINDVLYLHQYPGCLFILYIIYIILYIHTIHTFHPWQFLIWFRSFLHFDSQVQKVFQRVHVQQLLTWEIGFFPIVLWQYEGLPPIWIVWMLKEDFLSRYPLKIIYKTKLLYRYHI